MRFKDILCPVCKLPLSYESDGSGRWVASCNMAVCENQIAEHGAIGDTPEEAATKLIKILKEEGDWLGE